MRDYLYLAVLAVCAVRALGNPVFGILAFVGFSIVNPHSMTWGIGRSVPFAILLAVCTVIGYLFWAEKKSLPRQRELLLLALLWVLFAASSFDALFPDRAWSKFTEVSKVLFMVVLSMSLLTTRRRLHYLFYVLSLGLGAYAIKGGVFFILTGGAYRFWGPEDTFLAANNAIGLAIAMNVPILAGLIRLEERTYLRRLMVVMLACSYPAVIATFSRGAWLGLAAATGLLALRSKRKVLWTIGLVVAVVLVLPSLPETVHSRFDDLVNYEEEGSAQSRLWSWQLCYQVARANPWLGEGFGYYSLRATELYGGELLHDELVDFRAGTSAHSIWFAVLSEHGFLACGVWLALLGSCLMSLRRLRKLGETSLRPWIVRYSDMLLQALVVFMVVGTFYDAAYFDMMYQLVAAAIILKDGVIRRVEAFDDESARTDDAEGDVKLRIARARTPHAALPARAAPSRDR